MGWAGLGCSWAGGCNNVPSHCAPIGDSSVICSSLLVMILKKQYNDSIRKVDRAIYVKCKLKFYRPPKPANQYVNSIKQIDTGSYVKCN